MHPLLRRLSHRCVCMRNRVSLTTPQGLMTGLEKDGPHGASLRSLPPPVIPGPKLTNRECSVLELVGEGMLNKEIAAQVLHILVGKYLTKNAISPAAAPCIATRHTARHARDTRSQDIHRAVRKTYTA